MGTACQLRRGRCRHARHFPQAARAHLVLDGHCLHCTSVPDRRAFFANALAHPKPGWLLHIKCMCNDPHHVPSLPHFDPVHRCVVLRGIARRYFGKSDAIREEIAAAGCAVEKYQVLPAADEDCLLVNARAPSRP